MRLDPTAVSARTRSGLRVVGGLFVLVLLAAPVLSAPAEGVRRFALLFLSIVLEAVPFMLLGSAVSGLIEVFVSRDRLTAWLPRRAGAATGLAAALGLLLPVCECAVVPVVRRLVRKGLPVSAAVAYLLGGPIVNPIVLASTLLAYGGDPAMAIARLGAGYAIAVGLGLLMGRLFARAPALRAAAAAAEEDCACGLAPAPAPGGIRGTDRLRHALRHASDDFLAVAHYLVIGAALAALAQTVLDRRAVLALTDWPFVPSLVMMGLAILLNLCSEADAFIAASFRGLLPPPAQLAFLLTGPMLDLKLLLMYRTLFTRRAILALAALILTAVLLVAVMVEALGVFAG